MYPLVDVVSAVFAGTGVNAGEPSPFFSWWVASAKAVAGPVELQEGADLRLERGVGPFLGAVERPDDPATRRNEERARHLVAQVQPFEDSARVRPG